MRNNRFFLSYLPVMAAFGILSIWLANRYNGKTVMMEYRHDNSETAVYEGGEISDESVSVRRERAEGDRINGSELKDNGMPYAIKVNKKNNVVTVYAPDDNGVYNKPVKAMVCSVGNDGDTPTGKFSLGERYRWRELFGDCYGQYAVRITGNILFHSVPYYTRNSADLEVDEYNMLGESVSAGCVRLSVIDAKWIYDNCDNKTIVEIFESDYDGPLGKPVSAHIASMDGMNWDPTDPDRNNPYMKNAPVIVGAFDREVERYSDFDITAGITALDKYGNDITDRMKVQGRVDSDTCGDYQVTYSVTDENAEHTSTMVVFSVVDDELPRLEVNQVVTSIGMNQTTSGKRLLELLRKNVTAYDGEELLPDDSIIVDYSELFTVEYGSCRVKYMAKDSEGNQSDIVVLTVDVDLEAPMLTMKEDFRSEISKDKILDDEYMLSLVEASDNSGYVDVEVSRPLYYQDEELYKVMYYAKDKVGNITTLNVAYRLK